MVSFCNMGQKILLVEDDQFLRELNVETLQSEGFTVISAVDGEDALAKLKSDTYSIILVDIVIPKITGIEVIKRFKSEGGSLQCPVVFLTNMDEGKEIAEARSLGSGVLIKSEMTPPELVEKVKAFLTAKA